MEEDSFELLLTKYFPPPVQILCLIALVYMVKILFYRPAVQEPEEEPVERLEPMKKRDFTLQELKEYDGKSNQRILVAVNGKVFDVTRGKNYYGPGMLSWQALYVVDFVSCFGSCFVIVCLLPVITI